MAHLKRMFHMSYDDHIKMIRYIQSLSLYVKTTYCQDTYQIKKISSFLIEVDGPYHLKRMFCLSYDDHIRMVRYIQSLSLPESYILPRHIYQI